MTYNLRTVLKLLGEHYEVGKMESLIRLLQLILYAAFPFLRRTFPAST